MSDKPLNSFLGCSSVGVSEVSEVSDVSGGFDESLEFSTDETRIYGRSKERLTLLKTYQRLLQTKHGQTAIVHGNSGSGKTTLVDMLRLPVSASGGYFVTGKYIRNANLQEPHSAIMAAFSDLCDLVSQSANFSKSKRQQIKDALGSDAQLLVKSVSNFAPFVGNLDDAAEIEVPSIAKFKIACVAFLKAMSSNEHPIVMFIDDVQWADEGSRQLINLLLRDSQLNNVMLILVYRDEEELQVTDMLQYAESPIEIHVQPLDESAVYQLVSSILGSSSEEIRGLSELIMLRTAGNPFLILIFMETIQREGLLTFNKMSGCCVFSLKSIREEMTVTVDLLARKIELLQANTIDVLKVASMLGSQFTKPIISNVGSIILDAKRSKKSYAEIDISSTLSRAAVEIALSNAVNEGYLKARSDGRYSLVHDKIRFSLQSLINKPEEEDLHILIGKAFLVLEDGKGTNVKYYAAVHLNCAPSFLYNQKQRVTLARINLEASKYCQEISAFVQAAAMLQKALGVIGVKHRWSEENFDLSFEVMEFLAKIQMIIGDLEGCKRTTSEALKHGKTVEMKIKLLLIDVEVRMAGIEVNDAIKTALRSLNTLGVDVPSNVNLWHLVTKFLKVRRMLKGMTDIDILNLPIRQDEWITNTVRLLMHVCVYCLTKDENKLGMHAALTATELTLKMGLTPHSSSAFVFFGVAEVALGNSDRGCNYASLASAILDRMRCKEAECTTIGFATVFLSCRKKELQQIIQPLFHVAESGYQRGDIIYASYCFAQGCQMHLLLGTNLATLETLMRTKYEQVFDLNQDSMLLWFQSPLQYVLNMQSNASNWDMISVLTGEIMNEDDYFGQVSDANHPTLRTVGWLAKAEIACHFKQYTIAASLYEKGESMEETTRSCYGASPFYWNLARTYYGLFEQSGKWRHLRKGRKYKRVLQRMSAAGWPSATPLVAFLDARESTLRSDINKEDLHVTLRRGIESMVDSNLVHLEGLLNEEAWFAFAKRGLYADADIYLARALTIYREDWGATAKYRWLQEQHKQMTLRLRSKDLELSPSSVSNTLTPRSY